MRRVPGALGRLLFFYSGYRYLAAPAPGKTVAVADGYACALLRPSRFEGHAQAGGLGTHTGGAVHSLRAPFVRCHGSHTDSPGSTRGAAQTAREACSV